MIKSGYNNPSKSKCWKLFRASFNLIIEQSSPMFNHHYLFPGGSYWGRQEDKWGSFRGQDHFRGLYRSDCIHNIFASFVCSGIYPYRCQISGLRLLMLSCMSELSVEVLKITKHPNEATIKVRWRIKGIPLIRKAGPYIGRRIKVDADGYRYINTFS